MKLLVLTTSCGADAAIYVCQNFELFISKDQQKDVNHQSEALSLQQSLLV